MSDRNKICKCGNDVGNLINSIWVLGDNLKGTKLDDFAPRVDDIRESINFIYRNIGYVEDSCAIDARNEQEFSNSAFNKISSMETSKDMIKFHRDMDDVIKDLRKIQTGVMQKMRDCSR